MTTIGRPSIYHPSMGMKAVELMTMGASKIEVCAVLGISADTLYDWCDKQSDRYKPEFSRAIEHGVLLAQAWWERQGRENLINTKFNTGLWSKNMVCRFRKHWTETIRNENQHQHLDYNGNPVDPVFQVKVVHARNQNDGSLSSSV